MGKIRGVNGVLIIFLIVMLVGTGLYFLFYTPESVEDSESSASMVIESSTEPSIESSSIEPEAVYNSPESNKANDIISEQVVSKSGKVSYNGTAKMTGKALKYKKSFDDVPLEGNYLVVVYSKNSASTKVQNDVLNSLSEDELGLNIITVDASTEDGQKGYWKLTADLGLSASVPSPMYVYSLVIVDGEVVDSIAKSESKTLFNKENLLNISEQVKAYVEDK